MSKFTKSLDLSFLNTPAIKDEIKTMEELQILLIGHFKDQDKIFQYTCERLKEENLEEDRKEEVKAIQKNVRESMDKSASKINEIQKYLTFIKEHILVRKTNMTSALSDLVSSVVDELQKISMEVSLEDLKDKKENTEKGETEDESGKQKKKK